jgi:uncharacterized protein
MPNTRTNAPRGALVFDTRLLGRQAGSALTQTRTVPAPDDLRLELVGVPVGAEVALEVRFEAVSEGVLATGAATVPLTGECARCLAPLESAITASFQELYLYAEDKHDKHDRHEKRDRQDKYDKHDKYERHDEDEVGDGEERYLNGDLLDLEPAFRDAVVLALPMSPLCRDDCPGLCAECGVPLAEAGPDHGHDEAIDPRWAGLKQLDHQNGQNDQEDPDGQHGQTGKQPDRHAGAIDLQEG